MLSALRILSTVPIFQMHPLQTYPTSPKIQYVCTVTPTDSNSCKHNEKPLHEDIHMNSYELVPQKLWWVDYTISTETRNLQTGSPLKIDQGTTTIATAQIVF